MDIPLKPGVTEAYYMKAAQVGGSECLRNIMGCLSDQDPDPMGLALPDRDKGRKIIDQRIIPLYTKTKQLAEKLTGRADDIQKGRLVLSDHIIHLMWAGSPAALSSDPMCRAFVDEVDKFPEWAGKEADPVSLIRKRLTTYEDRARMYVMTTPTTARGKIAMLFENATLRLHFHVPCPHCGAFQRLVWSQIKWEKPDGMEGERHAQHVQATGAWYECEHCKRQIRESDKAAMVRAGRWASGDGEIADAESVDRFPPGTRIGFQVAAWYAMWVTFTDCAVEWIRAKGKLDETFAHVTQTQGVPFERRTKKTASEFFSAKSRASHLGEGIVPAWAVRLIATIDTQHDHFWLVIRAWGPGLRSQRVFHSRVDSFGELERWCWKTPWAVEGEASAPMTCDLVLIDSGGTKLAGESQSRTMQVYEWCQRMRGRAVPIKGSARPRAGTYWWDGEGFVKRVAHQKPQKIRIWYAAVHHWADQLQWLIEEEGDADNPPAWNLNARDDAEYNTHMANVQKVARRSGRTLIDEWVPVSSGARIDYRDCEVYQVAGAYWLNVHLLPSTEEIQRMKEEQSQAVQTAPRNRKGVGGWNVTPFGR